MLGTRRGSRDLWENVELGGAVSDASCERDSGRGMIFGIAQTLALLFPRQIDLLIVGTDGEGRGFATCDLSYSIPCYKPSQCTLS